MRGEKIVPEMEGAQMENKFDITNKAIEVNTGKGNGIKVTMSYGGDRSLEELLITYLE